MRVESRNQPDSNWNRWSVGLSTLNSHLSTSQAPVRRSRQLGDVDGVGLAVGAITAYGRGMSSDLIRTNRLPRLRFATVAALALLMGIVSLRADLRISAP